MAIIEKNTIDQRISLLTKAGLDYNDELKAYALKDNSVFLTDIEEMDDKEWEDSFNALMDDLRKGSGESAELIVKRELAGMADSDIVDLMKIIKDKDVMELAIHKKQIQKFKRKFADNKNLCFTNVDDKETYDKILLAWQTVKNYRTKQIEPDKKKRTSVLTAAVSFYNKKFNPISEDAKKIEAPLGIILDDWDKKIKDKKEEDKRLAAEQEALRTKQIEATGAVLNLGTGFYFLSAPEFNIPEVSIGASDINKISTELFDKFIKQFTETNEKIVAAKENKRIADEAEAEKERLKKLKEDEEREEEKKQLAQMRVETRSEVMEMIGMQLSEDKTEYFFNNIKVSIEDIGASDKPAWDSLLSETKEKIKSEKDRIKKEQDRKLRSTNRPPELQKLGFTLNASGVTFTHPATDSCSAKQVAETDDEEWLLLITNFQEKINAHNELQQQLETRHNAVVALSLDEKIRYNQYSYRGVTFDLHKSFIEKENWSDALDNIVRRKAVIDAAAILQAERHEKLIPYAEYGQQVNMSTLYTLADEVFMKLFDDKKAAKEKKLNDDLDKAEKDRKNEEAEKLAKSSDEEKWKTFRDYIAAYPSIEMGTEDYQQKMTTALLLVAKIMAI